MGASPRDTSPGRAVLSNLRAAAFEGSIDLVNPRYAEIEGIKAVKTIQDLPTPPDLVVIATPPQSVPGIVKAAGEKGAAAAIIITAGLGHGTDSLADGCEKAARATGLRLVGPNCLGVLSSRAKLNASFAARMPPTGDLALVSQSGAITAGLIEWSAVHGIGFSAVVSLGDKIDVDLGDLLDFFALDGATRAILLYVESINNARKFMSAARAAARIKPVVVVKSGRHAQGAKAAQTHTGALAGSDAVYEAAFRRAGLLRVLDLDELFAAAETLGRVRAISGQAAGYPHEWRRDRSSGRGPPRRSWRHSCRHLARDHAKARFGAAADLVARKSCRHRRRRRSRAAMSPRSKVSSKIPRTMPSWS